MRLAVLLALLLPLGCAYASSGPEGARAWALGQASATAAPGGAAAAQGGALSDNFAGLVRSVLPALISRLAGAGAASRAALVVAPPADPEDPVR